MRTLRPQVAGPVEIVQRAGFFQPRSAQLSARGTAKLQTLVDAVPDSARSIRIAITGASLGNGSQRSNERLAEARAQALESALADLGLSAVIDQTATVTERRAARSAPHTLVTDSGKPLSSVSVLYRTLTD